MPIARGATVGLRDIGPGKGGVAGGAKASGGEGGFDAVHHVAGGGGAEAVAQHHIRAGVAGAGMGFDRLVRHGVAVDQDGLTKLRKAFIHKAFQRGMVGVPDVADAVFGLGPWEFAAIDGAATRHDAGDDAKARGDAGVVGGAVDAFDHRGVEFVGGAVEVEIGARDAGGEQGRAVQGGGGKEAVYEGVFRGADRVAVQKAL